MQTLTTLLATALPALVVWGSVSTHLRWVQGRVRGRTVLVGWTASTVAVAALTAMILGVPPIVDLVFGAAVAVTVTVWGLLSSADRLADEQRRRVPVQRTDDHR